MKDSGAQTISSFSPTRGVVGTNVTVVGVFSGSSPTITFNSVAVTNIISFTTSQIVFTIPNGASTGKFTINDQGSVISNTDFIVEPSITSFTPICGAVGTSVTITGNGFALAYNDNTVSINNLNATITAGSITSLTITIPANATTGNFVISNSAGTATSQESFALAPTISSFFTKLTGKTYSYVGDSITITGTNFKNRNNTIRINNSSNAIITNETSTSLTFIIPNDAKTGTITVNNSCATVTSTSEFTILNPISNLTYSNLNKTTVTLNWNNALHQNYKNIEIDTSPNFNTSSRNYRYLGQITTYTYTNLRPATPYTVYVRATGPYGFTDSLLVSFRTLIGTSALNVTFNNNVTNYDYDNLLLNSYDTIITSSTILTEFKIGAPLTNTDAELFNLQVKRNSSLTEEYYVYFETKKYGELKYVLHDSVSLEPFTSFSANYYKYKNLEPSTSYLLRARIGNSQGYGEYSYFNGNNHITTLVKNKPTNVATYYTSDSLEITWNFNYPNPDYFNIYLTSNIDIQKDACLTKRYDYFNNNFNLRNVEANNNDMTEQNGFSNGNTYFVNSLTNNISDSVNIVNISPLKRKYTIKGINGIFPFISGTRTYITVLASYENKYKYTIGNQIFNYSDFCNSDFSFIVPAASSSLRGLTVSNLIANLTDYKVIRLSWNTLNGASKYLVKRSLSQTGNYENLGYITDNFYIDKSTSLNYNTRYYYTIRPYSDGGEFGDSLSINISTTSDNSSATFNDFTASLQDDAISLLWTNGGNIGDSIRIYRSVDNNDFEIIADLSSNKFSYIDNSSHIFNLNYKYKIVGVTKSLYSPFSKVINILYDYKPASIPPDSLRASLVTNNSITINWNYKPKYKENTFFIENSSDNLNWNLLDSLVLKDTLSYLYTYTVNKLSQGTIYYYRIASRDKEKYNYPVGFLIDSTNQPINLNIKEKYNIDITNNTYISKTINSRFDDAIKITISNNTLITEAIRNGTYVVKLNLLKNNKTQIREYVYNIKLTKGLREIK